MILNTEENFKRFYDAEVRNIQDMTLEELKHREEYLTSLVFEVRVRLEAVRVQIKK